jgi:hypothetical protein
VGCAAAAAALTLAAGGSILQAIQAGLLSFAQTGVYSGIGAHVASIGIGSAAGIAAKVTMHAVAGGAFVPALAAWPHSRATPTPSPTQPLAEGGAMN